MPAAWSSWLLWVLWTALAAQCALAVNGYLTEKRQGMQLSLARLYVIVGLFVLGTGLTVYAVFLPPLATAVTPTVAARPDIAPPVNQKELADAENEFNEAQAEFAKSDLRRANASTRLAKLRSQGQNPFTGVVIKFEQVSRSDRTIVALTGVAMLLAIGFAVLAFGGHIQTLFPEGLSFGRSRSEERDAALKELQTVIRLVWNEEYRDAIAKAEEIAEKHLGNFDNLDLYFLRGYCAVQIGFAREEGETWENLRPMFERAVTQLESVVERAPKRGEAFYTLALAYGLLGRNGEAVDAFDRARPMLTADKLPFEQNTSVCLLRQAESAMNTGDPQQAETHFRRVSELGTLSDSVTQSRLRVGMINLRGSMSRQDVSGAAAAIEQMSRMSSLGDEQRKHLDSMRATLQASLALRQDDPQTAFTISTEFLLRHLPHGLPAPDEDAPDETFSAVLDADLPFARDVFFGFFSIQSVAISRLETRGRHKLTEAQVAKLAEPLLRALQLVPRHREVLGAIGGLYYWFRREKRDKAREWLQSAVTMGVAGRIVRAILERDRLVEMERREALDWFRSASSRFLRDPTIAAQVRGALIEELGRFQEFEPLLISVREQPEPDAEEPTLEILRERGRYLADLVAGFASRGNSEQFTRLAKIHTEYVACLATLDSVTQTMTAIESKVFTEMGDTLVLT